MLCSIPNKDIKKEIILFIGNIRPMEFSSFVKRDIKIGLIFDKTSIFPYPKKSYFEFIKEVESLNNDEVLNETFNDISKKYHVLAIMNVLEPSVIAHSKLCKKMGYFAPSIESSIKAMDKTYMREAFSKYIEKNSNPLFQKISNLKDLLNFMDTSSFPIILKPSNLMGSMFVLISRNKKELISNYNTLVLSLPKYLMKKHKEKTLQLHAETFMEGSNHSIDCIIDKNGNVYTTPIVDVLTGLDIGRSDCHHFARICPTILTKKQIKECKEIVIKGCKALKLSSCSSHAEFIYTKKGPKLIEIAARVGGNRAYILEKVYGIDFNYEHYRMIMGMEPNVTCTKKDPMAIVTPFPEKKAILKGFFIDELIKGLNSEIKYSIQINKGKEVGPAKDGFLPPLKIELYNKSIDTIMIDIKKISLCEKLYLLN